jgi:maltose alpha-D-glucosyltransferase/alpha-amylase
VLAPEDALPSWHRPAPEPLPEYATIVVRRDLEEVLWSEGRAILEHEALPAYLQKRRWFGSKGEVLKSVRVAYSARLGQGLGTTLFTEVEAELGDRTETYALPMGICREEQTTGPLAQQLALTRVRRGPDVGYLTDAFALDAFTREMLKGMRAESVVPFDGGELEFTKTFRLDELQLPDDAPIHRLSAEQSNSTLIVAETIVLKVVRKVLAGIHPEAEMTGYLTERGFGNIAPLLGEVVRRDRDGMAHTVALAQGFVHNQGDGWAWTLEYLDRAGGEALQNDDEQTTDALSGYMPFAAAVGRRLAEMHAVLASDTELEDFRPEEATPDILRGWATGVEEQIDLALEAIGRVREFPTELAGSQAEYLTRNAARIRTLVHSLAQSAEGAAWQTRVHGDFHLGQVLVTSGDATLIDFEGEPAKTMAQRRAKSCPMRDVAGLLRSFDYAAATGAGSRAAESEAAAQRRQQFVQEFRISASRAFLEAYRAVLETAPRAWVTPQTQQKLLDLFLLEKAAYEIRYEIANRPTWVGIPLGGMARIAQRLLAAEEIPASSRVAELAGGAE